MLTGGDRNWTPPQFISLTPEEKPLPACLSGRKNGIHKRYNAALFPGEGIVINLKPIIEILCNQVQRPLTFRQTANFMWWLLW